MPPKYSGSRPSVRSIKASATRNTATPARFQSASKAPLDLRGPDDGLLADPVPYHTVTRDEADQYVRARYPFLYQRDDRNTQYQRNSEIEGAMETLQAEADRKYLSEKQRLDPIRREQDRSNRDIIYREQQADPVAEAGERVSREANTKTNPRQFFSKSERANMNRAEVYAAAGLKPEFQANANQVQDFFQELSDMDPERQKEVLDEIRAEANDSVDTYFDTRTEQIRTRLSEKISQLNAKHGLLSETEKYKLERAIGTLDRDVAEKLDKGIEAIFKRGGADSGLMQRLADEIISGRMIDVDDADKVFELNVKSGELQRSADQRNAELAASEDLYDVEQERKSERSQAYSDIVSDRTQQGLLAQILGGASEYVPKASLLTVPEEKKTMPVKPSQTALARGLLPGTSAPSGSSLDLARQAAAGTITPAQQMTAREALLFPNGRPNPVSSPQTIAKPIKPSPVRNPLTGVSYSGAAGARLAARLSR